MNKFIFLKKIIFSLLFFSYLSVSSQDVITKNDGSDIESIIKEITIDGVKYVKYSNQDGPLYTVTKFDVFRIKYSNGEIETFNNDLQSKSISSDLERKVSLIISNNESHRITYNTGKMLSISGQVLTGIGSYDLNPTVITVGLIATLVGEITIWSSHAWFSSSRINLFSNTVSHNKKSQILQNEVNNQFSTEKTLIGSDGFFSSDDFIIGQSINVILDDGTSFSGKVLNNKPKMLVFKENNGSRRLFWYTEIKEAYEM